MENGPRTSFSFEKRRKLKTCYNNVYKLLKTAHIQDRSRNKKRKNKGLLLYSVRITCHFTALSVEDQREAIGISDNLLRFSVGIENKEDISKDIEQALKES